MNRHQAQIAAIMAGLRANKVYAYVIGNTSHPTIQLFNHPADRHPVMSVELIDKRWIIGNSADPVALAMTETTDSIVASIIEEWENLP